MSENRVYYLVDGVQVRPEKFGLLFYNYRGPRLYFVASQDLLPVDFFAGRQTVADLAARLAEERHWPLSWVRNWVEETLAILEAKGLIYGQSLC